VAARVRNAASTSDFFEDIYRNLQRIWVSDECMCKLPDPRWLQNSCIFSMQRALTNVSASGFSIQDVVKQRDVSIHLGSLDLPFDALEFFAR
jgi:hypothetical protein